MSNEPSVTLSGKKPNLAVTKNDLISLDKRISLREIKHKKFLQRQKNLEEFYGVLDKYSFGFLGTALKTINNKASISGLALLMNYQIAATTPVFFADLSNIPAAVRVIDPKLFARFNTVPTLPSGTLISPIRSVSAAGASAAKDIAASPKNLPAIEATINLSKEASMGVGKNLIMGVLDFIGPFQLLKSASIFSNSEKINMPEPEKITASAVEQPPVKNKEWLETITRNEKELENYYSLTPDFISGYYGRRILPYLANPSYTPENTDFLFRGMLLNVQDLKDILKDGLLLEKTSWNVGAEDKKPIISSSSNYEEAKSYIFQSDRKDRGIGVVVKLTKTKEDRLWHDDKLNRTKTIYHTYSSIPASRIADIAIFGQYGMEKLNTVEEKIKSGRAANTSWLNSFSR